MVKRGPATSLEEARNIEFVRRAAPRCRCPRLVHCAFPHKGCTYIVSDHLRGKVLWIWRHTATAGDKDSILRQLIGHMSALRCVPNPNPSGQVSGVKGGPLCDDRYTSGKGVGPHAEGCFGPFPNTHAFHLWLRNGFTYSDSSPEQVRREEESDKYVDINRMCQIQDGCDYSTTLTHGDFSSLNIIVKKRQGRWHHRLGICWVEPRLLGICLRVAREYLRRTLLETRSRPDLGWRR